jgi:cholesterol transport system auxiliary component
MDLERRRWLAAAATTTLALATGGCSLLAAIPKVNEPLDLYTLTPKTTFDPNLPKVSWQLIVEQPVAAGGLDSARIALQHTPYTLEYYAKASWTDNAPSMIQTLLVASFERSGKIVSVGRESVGLRPDYLLKTELREFQALYFDIQGNAPRIAVRINAKVIEMPDRRIIASRTIYKEEKAATPEFKDIINAFDDALGKALRDIVAFTLTAPQNRGQPEPPPEP